MSDNRIKPTELDKLKKLPIAELKAELEFVELDLCNQAHSIALAQAEVRQWEAALEKKKESGLKLQRRQTAIETLIAFRETYPAK